MYEIEEHFTKDGVNLKDVLMGCIYNYYLEYKKEKINIK